MNVVPLKIVHLSTYLNGGAGSAAYRLHKALLKNNVDSSFVCLEQTPGSDNTAFTLKRPTVPLWARAIKKVLWLLPWLNDKLINKRTADIRKFEAIYPSLQCSFASLPFSSLRVLEHPAVIAADIIHLHWIAGMIDYPTFFKKNNKPVVWTLHDMNPFSGLYHYTEDEIRNEDITGAFSRNIHGVKKTAIQHRRNLLTFVTPSNWLLQEAGKSDTFKGIPGIMIPNPVDTEDFSPRDTKMLRHLLKIPKENTVFIFVAETVDDYRKGFDLLTEALKALISFPVTLLAIGKGVRPEGIPGDIRFLGSTNDPKKLSEYYSLADALIIPSREDNLPNVMTEAMACGTPVISFDTGGMSTTIEDGFNGFRAKVISAVSLKETLIEFIKVKESFKRESIRLFAMEHFGFDKVSRQYQAVYETLPPENN